MLADADDRWFGIAELVEYSTLSDKTIRRHLRAREHPIPHHKVGGRVLIKRSEFDAWVIEGPAPQPRSEASMDERVARALRRSREVV